MRSTTPCSPGLTGRIATVAIAFLLFSCQHKTPEQELLQKTEAVGSWLSSLEMAGEKWAVNSVPRTFVRTSAGAALKAFQKADKAARESDARPEVRDGIRQVIADGEAEGHRLRRAAEANDRAAALPITGRLKVLKARFESLKKACEGAS
jgi:hypothetical protein